MTVNFTNAQDLRQHASGHSQEAPFKPLSSEGKLLTPKQIRARARRRMKRGQLLNQEELHYLYDKKPIEEWDLDELAHGRPRNSKGHFKGPNPTWITSAVHEEAMAKYTAAVKTSMRATTVDALGLLKELIENDERDEKGKPLVAYSTKLDAAKFLLEHVVGKPTQRIENDVSVKLQGILGQVLVNPEQLNAQQDHQYMLGHYPGITMELATGLADDDDDPMEDFSEPG